MNDYRITTLADHIAELKAGNFVCYPWELSGPDDGPDVWAEKLEDAARIDGTFDVQVIKVVKHSLSLAFNSALPAPATERLKEIVDHMKAIRERGGILRVLPTKEALAESQQVSPNRLATGPHGLRIVPALPGHMLRIVG